MMRNHFRKHHRLQGSENAAGSEVLPGALSDLLAGQSGVVSHLNGGKEFVNRILSLGFTIGAQVTVLSNQGRGPVAVSILGTHLALGRQEAARIQVRTE